MYGLRFRIQHPDGRLEDLVLESDRVMIGSGAHCEIRLGVDQAAVEHVLLQMSPTGPVAEARSFQPPATINESPFNRSPLMPGSVLGVGQTRIWVEASELGAGAEVQKKKQEKTSPMTLILAAVAVPISLYILLDDSGPSGPGDAPSDVPALWAEPVKSCPQAAPEAALALARDRATRADAKRERRPFAVQDGVAAVPLYEQAAACFKAAGNAKAAKSYGEVAAGLRQDVANDFRTHRVRLDHAMSIKDWDTAQKEVRVLLAFTDGIQNNDYVTWLSNVDRRLRLKFGGGNKN